MDNLSVIACKFDWGTDLDVATNDIRDKLDLARRELPDDVEEPILSQSNFTSILNYFSSASISSIRWLH
jgi:HAE1 family hydrophobic/amphiphilic exporter-1